jgi:hypothetical protein
MCDTLDSDSHLGNWVENLCGEVPNQIMLPVRWMDEMHGALRDNDGRSFFRKLGGRVILCFQMGKVPEVSEGIGFLNSRILICGRQESPTLKPQIFHFQDLRIITVRRNSLAPKVKVSMSEIIHTCPTSHKLTPPTS